MNRADWRALFVLEPSEEGGVLAPCTARTNLKGEGLSKGIDAEKKRNGTGRELGKVADARRDLYVCGWGR